MPTVSFNVNYILFLQDRLFKTVSEQYICSWFCWRSSCYVLHIQAFSTYKTVDHPYFRIIPCHRCLPTIRWTSASSDSSVTLLFETAGVLFSWRRYPHGKRKKKKSAIMPTCLRSPSITRLTPKSCAASQSMTTLPKWDYEIIEIVFEFCTAISAHFTARRRFASVTSEGMPCWFGTFWEATHEPVGRIWLFVRLTDESPIYGKSRRKLQ